MKFTLGDPVWSGPVRRAWSSGGGGHNSMVGRDWFIVGCRLIGVWVAYTALTYVTAYLDVRLGYTAETGRSSQSGGLLIHGFGHLLLAPWSLGGLHFNI